MDAALLTALSTVLAKLVKANGPLAPGHYNVSDTVTLAIDGEVVKGEDESYTPTVDIPLLATLALFIEGLRGKVQQVQVETIMETLVESMTAALSANVKADPVLKARLADIDAAMARVRSMTAALPDKTRTGKTIASGRLAMIVNGVPVELTA
jgi:hypothetical protein